MDATDWKLKTRSAWPALWLCTRRFSFSTTSHFFFQISSRKQTQWVRTIFVVPEIELWRSIFLAARTRSGSKRSNQNTAALYKRYENSVVFKSCWMTTVNKPTAAKTNLIHILINPGHFAMKRKQTLVFHSAQSFDLIVFNLREER